MGTKGSKLFLSLVILPLNLAKTPETLETTAEQRGIGLQSYYTGAAGRTIRSYGFIIWDDVGTLQNCGPRALSVGSRLGPFINSARKTRNDMKDALGPARSRGRRGLTEP